MRNVLWNVGGFVMVLWLAGTVLGVLWVFVAYLLRVFHLKIVSTRPHPMSPEEAADFQRYCDEWGEAHPGESVPSGRQWHTSPR